MKNGLGQYQNVLLVGSSSQIGNVIVDFLPLSSSSRVFRVGLDSTSDFFLDLTSQVGTDSLNFIDELPDIDVAIFASGFLADSQNKESHAGITSMALVNFANLILLINRISLRMKVQGFGKIVILSSVAALRPRTENYVYGATKAGLDFYARGLHAQLKGTGVSILLVRPGFVCTEMTKSIEPAPFATTPEFVGKSVAAALRGNARVLYIPGILKFVFFALRLLPEWLFAKITSK
jgi:decaprenylphospho-beta-D-erythro-pentofuranosid-2-ulose 2-reductase